MLYRVIGDMHNLCQAPHIGTQVDKVPCKQWFTLFMLFKETLCTLIIEPWVQPRCQFTLLK